MSLRQALRTSAGPGVFLAFLSALGIAGIACVGAGLLFAVPMLSMFVAVVLRAAERAADDMPTRVTGRRWVAPGVSALLCILGVCAAAVVGGAGTGIGLTELLARLPWWGTPAWMAAAVLAAMLFAAVFAPAAFVPFAAEDRELGLGAGIGRGLEVAQCDRRGALAWTAARAAAVLVLPAVLLSAAEAAGRSLGEFNLVAHVLGMFATGPCLWLAASMLAERYVAARRIAPPKDASRRLPPVVKPAIAVSLVMAAAVAGVSGWAALTPTSARERVQDRALRRLPVLALSPSEDVTLPGTYLRLRAVSSGVLVSTPDGGGAGAIRCLAWPDVPQNARVALRGDVVELVWPGDAPTEPYAPTVCEARLSRSGVRLDDGLDARLFATGGLAYTLGALAALLGMLLLAFGAMRFGLEARVLHAADPTRADAGGGPRALEGAVKAATVESDDGAFRFRLPGGARFAEGERVTVVARFEALTSGLRDAPRALPARARVLRGSLEDARRAIAAHATRVAGYAAGFVIAGSVVATVTLVRALLRAR